MLDFYEVTSEVKIRQNIVQICETIKNKDMSDLITIKEVDSEDVSSRIRSIFCNFNTV